jgi:hypothetical protein
MIQIDRQSEASLALMTESEQALTYRVSGVRFILVVLSARGMIYDFEAVRYKIMHSYPDAAIFFQTTLGKPVGPVPPGQIDLLIDFTGPGQRQNWLYPFQLRKKSRVAVGRNAGLFRKRLYDRIFDETRLGTSGSPESKVHQALSKELPKEMLERERFVQKKVFDLAGVALIPMGEVLLDRGDTIALELPGMQNL